MRGRGVVVVFGVFDILHPGHLDFLTQANKKGDSLVVVVSRDARVKKEKGTIPIFKEKERLKMIKSLSVVSKAFLGDQPGRWSIVSKLKPDIIVVGHDQKIPTNGLSGITVVRLAAHRGNQYSTSQIRKKLASKF